MLTHPVLFLKNERIGTGNRQFTNIPDKPYESRTFANTNLIKTKLFVLIGTETQYLKSLTQLTNLVVFQIFLLVVISH